MMNKVVSTKKAYIVLADGSIYEGQAFGAEKESTGELVFTTGVCGYIETLTDPSYYGQIIMQTFPLIGNYGIIESDFEGRCAAKGYVVREWCDTPSNFRSQYNVDKFLKENGVPAISGIDTREITKKIREKGVMNAKICYNADDIEKLLREINSFEIKDAVASVSTHENSVYPAEAEKDRNLSVVLLDYGAKKNIVRELNKRGCNVRVLPHDTSAEDILAFAPDGVMLSNGPGDPAENVVEIREIEKLFGKIPMFGICLGHQLMAIAAGGRTVKLHYGHRGTNQPVRDIKGNRTYITSQNHGYAVVSESVKGVGEVNFVNANDATCEGIVYNGLRAFSAQFHPEACSGTWDTSFLFDRFIDLMTSEKGGKINAAR